MPKRKTATEVPKRASKPSKAANPPTIAAKTPAELVYAVPEIRQRLLSFLDLPTLAAFIRVEKAASNDVARELYKEVDYKHMLNKMSRTNRRRLLSCDAVRTVLVKDHWLTPAVFKEIVGRDYYSLIDQLWSVEREYRPAAILAIIKVARKKCPNVRCIQFVGKHCEIIGAWDYPLFKTPATWIVHLDTARIDLSYTIMAYGPATLGSRKIPFTPGFTTHLHVKMVYKSQIHADWSKAPASIGTYRLQMESIDWEDVSVPLPHMTAFIKAHLERPGAARITEIAAANVPKFGLQALLDLLQLTGTGLQTLRLSHSKHEMPVGVTPADLPQILAQIDQHASALVSLQLPLHWDDSIEDACHTWTVPVKVATSLKHVTLYLNKVPDREPINLALYLSRWMPTGAKVTFSWNDFSLPRVVKRQEWHRFYGIHWVTVDTKNVRSLEMQDCIRNIRLALLPSPAALDGVNLRDLGLFGADDAAHLVVDAAGGAEILERSLVTGIIGLLDDDSQHSASIDHLPAGAKDALRALYQAESAGALDQARKALLKVMAVLEEPIKARAGRTAGDRVSRADEEPEGQARLSWIDDHLDSLGTPFADNKPKRLPTKLEDAISREPVYALPGLWALCSNIDRRLHGLKPVMERVPAERPRGSL